MNPRLFARINRKPGPRTLVQMSDRTLNERSMLSRNTAAARIISWSTKLLGLARSAPASMPALKNFCKVLCRWCCGRIYRPRSLPKEMDSMRVSSRSPVDYRALDQDRQCGTVAPCSGSPKAVMPTPIGGLIMIPVRRVFPLPKPCCCDREDPAYRRSGGRPRRVLLERGCRSMPPCRK